MAGSINDSSTVHRSNEYHQDYSYVLGLKAGDVVLPDPSEWNYTVGDLDTSGKRDASGLLHRAYVATKINYEFQWKALEWEMLQVILEAVSSEKFTFTGPDPRTFNKPYTGDYYVGDRTGKALYFMDKVIRPEIATYTLKLKFIEY